jgi:hypothetical protein
LSCRPGSEAALLAGFLSYDLAKVAELTGLSVESISAAAKAFQSANSGTIILVPSQDRPGNDLLAYFAKLLAANSPNKKYYIAYQGGNTLGVNRVIDSEISNHASYPQIVDKINRQEIKALVAVGSYGLDMPKIADKLKLFILADYFSPDLPLPGLHSLPLASQLECEGSYLLADGRLAEVVPVRPPVGGVAGSWIINLLSGKKLDDVGVVRAVQDILGGAKTEAAVTVEEKVQAALGLKISEKVRIEPIVDFGDNNLVRNFFWHKVNA